MPGALERLRTRILYEDSGLLVLNKPAGMAVHGGSGVSYGVIEYQKAPPAAVPPLCWVYASRRLIHLETSTKLSITWNALLCY